MSPTGGETSKRNADVVFQLQAWNKQTKLGVAFDSSGGFKLPNGAIRSSDTSWLKKERWNTLTPEQHQKFPPLCPDFVVELCSPSDSLGETQEKMQEYMDNKARLGWLIDSQNQGTGFLAGDAMNPWLCEELMDGDRAIAVSHRHSWRGLTSQSPMRSVQL